LWRLGIVGSAECCSSNDAMRGKCQRTASCRAVLPLQLVPFTVAECCQKITHEIQVIAQHWSIYLQQNSCILHIVALGGINKRSVAEAVPRIHSCPSLHQSRHHLNKCMKQKLMASKQRTRSSKPLAPSACRPNAAELHHERNSAR
jgi:hypothetical protein